MRMDWLPISAALLVTGALALCLGSFLLPSSDSTADTLRIVQQQGGQWLTVAAIFFLASVCLTLGLPAVLTLFDRRGWTLGMISAIVLEVGFIGTAGFAMLMVFFRSLVITDALRDQGLEDASSEAGLTVFLGVWIAGLYLGELLLGIALLRARATPRWVPFALIAHALSFVVSSFLPELLAKSLILLLVAGFCGIAIQATQPGPRRRYS
ncbi:hypothetical protein ACFP8W_18995 [Nocardioides hankookensis]|uniref:Uncharacterized protein n=1 Tax=Nocardioides hankookensis TaxID=443157 RepID=A0ABW1LML3_9ACTN